VDELHDAERHDRPYDARHSRSRPAAHDLLSYSSPGALLPLQQYHHRTHSRALHLLLRRRGRPRITVLPAPP
jgi:hypothetical protein